MIVVLLLGSSVAEQVTVNHLVAGSTPARAAIFKTSLRKVGGFFLSGHFPAKGSNGATLRLRRVAGVKREAVCL